MIDFSALDDILKNKPESFRRITLAKPVSAAGYIKISIRPIKTQNGLVFHAEQFTNRQSFHRNFKPEELLSFLQEMAGTYFKFFQTETDAESITILVSKKGHATVLRKPRKTLSAQDDASSCKTNDSHNRRKKYFIAEGIPVPFLVQLGIMTKEGKVIAQKYDKFRQINHFLEYIDDILDAVLTLPDGTKKDNVSVIDFGCGKSYLTFAVYHYLTEICGLKAHIVGLDLKEDVIILCSTLAKEFAYSGLSFQTGDIASYKTDNTFDLMITLHACDTATDYALAQAVKWQIKAVLSVPCCQHEINHQLDERRISSQFSALLKYGIIKERFAALATDVMRAQILEQSGYAVQLLEFIDITHTPKNLLIRAIKITNSSAPSFEPVPMYTEFRNALAVTPTLENLL